MLGAEELGEALQRSRAQPLMGLRRGLMRPAPKAPRKKASTWNQQPLHQVKSHCCGGAARSRKEAARASPVLLEPRSLASGSPIQAEPPGNQRAEKKGGVQRPGSTRSAGKGQCGLRGNRSTIHTPRL